MPASHFTHQNFSQHVSQLDLSALSVDDALLLQSRIKQHGENLWESLSQIYGESNVSNIVTKLLNKLLLGFSQRTRILKQKDKVHLSVEPWYLEHSQVGMACYVDRFATDLDGLKQKIPYLKELGITFLHLLPLYDSPEGDSDGGYAVSSYRKVNPVLGNMQQLRNLIEEFNKNDIHVVLDFIFNHTSDEHIWAKRAIAGEKKYQNFYFLFDDRTVPDKFDPFLREIFPHVRRGSFSFREDIQKWIWTTFNNYQWDLNYSNYEVLCEVIDEMLFLSNTGCDVLRLDALSFIWKDAGSNCESRPNAYRLINVLNICLKIVAPSVMFKSEAIVHPNEVAKYVAPERCQLSYNPMLMGLLWSSLATENTDFITQSLTQHFEINENCVWINYVRCHDDIGWFFDQQDADVVGIEIDQHIKKLKQFYTDKSANNFATGISFQNDPSVDHQGICGSLASLCGLEKAIETNDHIALELSIGRINLMHSIILSIGGIPLIYSGDELAMLNDYQYLDNPEQRHDARWVNRPKITSKAITNAMEPDTPQNKIYLALAKMISIRKSYPIFGKAKISFCRTPNTHLFIYQRINKDGVILLSICNFSRLPQTLKLDKIEISTYIDTPFDLISGSKLAMSEDSTFNLLPYQVMWLING